MPAFRHAAALALTVIFLAPVAALADDSSAPHSRAPTLCGGPTDSAPIAADLCKGGGYDGLAAQLDKAIQAAAMKAPADVRPLLKRDQAFFDEMIAMAGVEMPQSDTAAIRRQFEGILRNRIATLPQIADGFGRGGVSGKWIDAFGSVTVTPTDDGAYRVAIDTSSIYGLDQEQQWSCQASALVKPDESGWISGAMSPEPQAVDQHSGRSDVVDENGKPSLPPAIKLRRQGDTLRVVVGVPDETSYTLNLMPHCRSARQVTGTFFASGKSETAAAEKGEVNFTKPTFDCAHPESASDEEICADPELADNDQRLNRTWKALLPRLDDITRRALVDDQRRWAAAQARQYALSLHPRMSRIPYGMHDMTGGRDGLSRMQRARIALLEGFDENRKGMAGAWLSYTAALNVTVADGGDLEAKGWKWEQGSWKDGCEYDMSGTVKGGTFRADGSGKNPDTLERDHATLIVSRRDDAFAKERGGPKGVDEMKCRRSMEASSTARLFPAKPSPDIDAFSEMEH